LAPTRANGEVAPKPAVTGTLVVRLKSTRLGQPVTLPSVIGMAPSSPSFFFGYVNSTLLGHSAFALGMALLPHLEGLFQASAWYDGSTSTAMVKDI